MALSWATKRQKVHPYTWTVRLSMVSGFARFLKTLDPACEVPPADLLSHRRRPRPEPYLYADAEVVALLDACSRLSPPLRAATYRTLFGLLAVSGLRVGEAIRLDGDDVDLDHGLLVVWQGKFRKAREVPLHPSAVEALRTYGQLRDELRRRRKQASFFVSTVGTPLCESAVRATFAQLVRWVGLEPKSPVCRPRIHSLRHTFAVATLLGWYRAGDDVMAKVPLLSTYLGHVGPVATYWYLQATPDLLAQALGRLENFLEKELGEAIGLGVVVLAITYLSLIVGELVPKRLAINNPELIASRVAGPIRVLSRLAGPLVSLLTVSTDLILRLLLVRPSHEAAISEEEVRVLIAQGTQAGVFEEAERELVKSAFELGETRVEELMTPRPLVTWLDADDPPGVGWQKSVESSHSYYPVCRGELDQVVGVLSLRELAECLLAGQRPKLADLARQPLLIPQQLSAFRALQQFKQVGSRLALVLDEQGGITGVLTPTDVLEALVGELAPAEGEERIRPVRREDGTWLLDGLISGRGRRCARAEAPRTRGGHARW